jgi:hypothetical protein
MMRFTTTFPFLASPHDGTAADMAPSSPHGRVDGGGQGPACPGRHDRRRPAPRDRARGSAAHFPPPVTLRTRRLLCRATSMADLEAKVLVDPGDAAQLACRTATSAPHSGDPADYDTAKRRRGPARDRPTCGSTSPTACRRHSMTSPVARPGRRGLLRHRTMPPAGRPRRRFGGARRLRRRRELPRSDAGPPAGPRPSLAPATGASSTATCPAHSRPWSRRWPRRPSRPSRLPT